MSKFFDMFKGEKKEEPKQTAEEVAKDGAKLLGNGAAEKAAGLLQTTQKRREKQFGL
jgi:hypothetical protein